MFRITVGLSFLVLLGVAGACSSKSTSDNAGSSGNGTVLNGGSSSGGTTSAAGTGGTRNDAGTTSSIAGTAASTGGGTGLCTDDTVTCVDNLRASGCNPATGATETIDCVQDYATLGITSTGCSADLNGVGCDITSFKDAACLAGAQGYAFCTGGTTDDLVGAYIDCFQDYMGVRSAVSCIGNYVSETMMATTDCQAANDACFPGAGGAGGAGSIDPGTAGAGGAP